MIGPLMGAILSSNALRKDAGFLLQFLLLTTERSESLLSRVQ